MTPTQQEDYENWFIRQYGVGATSIYDEEPEDDDPEPTD